MICAADVVPTKGEIVENFRHCLQLAPELLVPLLIFAAFILVMRRPRA